jgi:hypothetical protein
LTRPTSLIIYSKPKSGHPERVSSTAHEALKRRIDYTDSEIDKLVYKLYNLTDDEIKIVEGRGNS